MNGKKTSPTRNQQLLVTREQQLAAARGVVSKNTKRREKAKAAFLSLIEAKRNLYFEVTMKLIDHLKQHLFIDDVKEIFVAYIEQDKLLHNDAVKALIELLKDRDCKNAVKKILRKYFDRWEIDDDIEEVLVDVLSLPCGVKLNVNEALDTI